MKRTLLALCAASLVGCGPGGSPSGEESDGALARAAIDESLVPEPMIDEPWVRAAPPTATVMAGYLRISAGATEITVSGVDCEGFGRTELHETRLTDGVASMRRLDSVTVPAGESRSFAPGAMHLMLMAPAQIPTAGASVACSLSLADGRRLAFQAPVRAGATEDAHEHHRH